MTSVHHHDIDTPTMYEKLQEANDLNLDKAFDRAENERLAKKYLWAAPQDPRFPQQNKNKWCFTYFVDYHRCIELKGDDYAPCKYLKNVYMDICPRYWVSRWDEWVEEGRFPARFDK